MATLSNTSETATEMVVPHAWLAGLLALSWGNQATYEPRLVHGIGQRALALGGWLVRAVHVDGSGITPPHFGVFRNCDPKRRCVGCELGCSAEAELIGLADLSGLRVMSLLSGGEANAPFWAQVQLWMPRSPSLSGPWTPIIEYESHIFRLVSPDGRTVLTPTVDGFTLSQCTPARCDLADERRLFLRTLGPGIRMVRDLFEDGQIGPLRVGGYQ